VSSEPDTKTAAGPLNGLDRLRALLGAGGCYAQAVCAVAANEIEHLRAQVASLKIELEGAAHNRFYDQRDAYFEGREDGR